MILYLLLDGIVFEKELLSVSVMHVFTLYAELDVLGCDNMKYVDFSICAFIDRLIRTKTPTCLHKHSCYGIFEEDS